MRLILTIILALLCVPAFAQDQGESALLLTGGGSSPIITYTSAYCVNGLGGISTSCPMAASAAVGDLLLIVSKTGAVTSSTTATVSWTDIVWCSSPTQVIPASTWQPNGSGHFSTTMFACIVTTAGAATPVVSWTGSNSDFTDIDVAVYHTTTSWKTTFVDQSATNISATASTSCPTGTTATTTNAHDLIVAICENYNVGETWGTLSGFSNRATSSRNTAAWYDTTVSSTGAQSTTIPLSASDVGIGMIVTFASN